MLWQSLDFWTWQNVTRDSEPWEPDPVMSTRFLEAICSFDQVVPEIGKKKSPCPIMVSDTDTRGQYKPVSDSPDASVTCEACRVWWGPISPPCQLRPWVMLMIRSHSQSPDWRALGPLPSSRLSDGQTGERCERCETFLARVGRCRVLYSLGGNRSEKININT